MDQIADLMSRNIPQEPPAVAALKNYVKDHYRAEARVLVTNQNYILSVKSASLAGNLQHEVAEMTRICQLDKPLRIRISY